MREAREILARARELRAAGRPAALATVVAVEGSAYRREGARLLVAPAAGAGAPGDDAAAASELTGVLSGGCLERDLAVPAARVAATGSPELVTYDLRADEEAIWGFGLGCAGKVGVLVEPLAGRGGEATIAAFAVAIEERREARLATVVAAPAASAATRGDRLLLTLPLDSPARVEVQELAAEGASTERAFASGGDTASWIAGARRELLALAPGAARSARIVAREGDTELLVESILPPVHFLVVGAERDVPALLRLAGELGWEATVVDPRPTAAAERRFAGLARYLGAPLARLPAEVELGWRTAALVATHRYLDDLEALVALAPARLGYLGLLGPGRRRERLLADLERQGHLRSAGALAALRGPAGLDLGGRSPEEVALAVAAEVQAVLGARPGRALSDTEAAPVELAAHPARA